MIAYWIKRSIKYKVTHNGTMSKLLAPSVSFTSKKTYVCFAGEVSKPALPQLIVPAFAPPVAMETESCLRHHLAINFQFQAVFVR